MLGPTLETERLILRPPSAEDFEAYATYMADPSTVFIGGPQERPTAWRGLASIIGAWTLNGYSMFSFIEKETGEWVGRGGPWKPEAWPGAEVGWGIVPSRVRRGYAREASAACLDWAFEHLGWTEVIHCIDAKNVASIATAKSLGSGVVRTNVAAPPPFDVTWDLYGQTREQWRARKRG